MRQMRYIGAMVFGFLLIAVQAVTATQIKPVDPISGWLFDEQYGSLGTVVTDSFGSLDAVTAGTYVGTNGITPSTGPESSTDTPFNYAGNMSMSTVNGPLSAGSSTNYWRANFNVGSFRDLLSGTSAVSIQAWVKYDPTTGPITERVLLAGHINNTVGGIWLSIGGTGETPGTVQVGGRSQTTDLYQKLNSDTTLIPNEWNHIVGVIDYANDTLRVAINGGAFKTGSANFGSDTFTPGTGTTQPDFISGRSQGSRFIGLIDEVAIWRSALTQDNVEWLYNNSISVPEPTSLVLLGVGMIPLFSWIRRRK